MYKKARGFIYKKYIVFFVGVMERRLRTLAATVRSK
jgi:hypothetical protein